MSDLRDAMADDEANNAGMLKVWHGISKNGNRTPQMVLYEKKLSGVINSKIDEFQMSQELFDMVMKEWVKHKDSQRVEIPKTQIVADIKEDQSDKESDDEAKEAMTPLEPPEMNE